MLFPRCCCCFCFFVFLVCWGGGTGAPSYLHPPHCSTNFKGLWGTLKTFRRRGFRLSFRSTWRPVSPTTFFFTIFCFTKPLGIDRGGGARGGGIFLVECEGRFYGNLSCTVTSAPGGLCTSGVGVGASRGYALGPWGTFQPSPCWKNGVGWTPPPPAGG